MKHVVRIFIGLFIAFFAGACEEEVVLEPKASMTINKTQLSINESMVVTFTGTADQAVIFTGDSAHVYDLREESNTGFVMNKGVLSYAYPVPGKYKIVCLASAYNDGATTLKRDTCSFTVTVIDDMTEIERLSCPQILYDEVFADRLSNDEWFMKLPRKVVYNQQTPSISLSQRLSFYIQSDSTKVFINGEAYKSATKYNLANQTNITVKSHYGTERFYKLHTLYYPEFTSFKLAGVEGILFREQFDYSAFRVEVTLPKGTDVNNIIPEFTLTDTVEKAYIGDVEQISGNTEVDFSQNVVYRLESVSQNNAEAVAISTVTVKINFQ